MDVGKFKKGVINDSDLLKLALGKLNVTKEELEEEYEKHVTELEDIKDRCKGFEKYCTNRSCVDCEIRKFKKDNNLKELSTGGCILVYEYLLKRGCWYEL